MRARVIGAGLVLVLGFAGGLVQAGPAQAGTAKVFKNCTALNAQYKHGVGHPGTKDRVRGKTKPVTTFKVDRKLYNANKRLDRDKDRVACEKR